MHIFKSVIINIYTKIDEVNFEKIFLNFIFNRDLRFIFN